MNSETFVRNYGTGWESITSESCALGKIEHNIFKEKSGPFSYAKRNIKNGYAISLRRLLLDEPMLRHIKNCTEKEAHRQLGRNEWPTTLDELDAFISILYTRERITKQDSRGDTADGRPDLGLDVKILVDL
ncbi:hypothetical protein TNCV_4515711 [Trichonephila clavipes]|nr:hypothetical protein TNCV_4515711 [Trichonephila clavipes]